MHIVVLAVEAEEVPAFVNLAEEGEYSRLLVVAARTVAGAPAMDGSAAAAAVLVAEGHVPNETVVALVVLVPADNGASGEPGFLLAKDGAAKKPAEKDAEVD